MRAILDTHIFLWWNMDDPQLSQNLRSIIADGRNEILFSAASAWEIAIKSSRGRLSLPEPPDRYVANRLNIYRFQPLPVHLSHALHVYNLPPIHHDPFDRLIIAQAQLEDIPILTSDNMIARYNVETFH